MKGQTAMKKDQDFGFYGKGLDGYIHYRQGMEEAKRNEPKALPKYEEFPTVEWDEPKAAPRRRETPVSPQAGTGDSPMAILMMIIGGLGLLGGAGFIIYIIYTVIQGG